VTLPTLHPHAATWAANTCPPPYPNQLAHSIGAPRPDRIEQTVGTLIGLSPVLNYGVFDIDGQADKLAAGWSAPEPVGYLRGLASATSSAAAVIDAARDAVLPVIQTLRTTQAAAARAIDTANTATDWSQGYQAYGTPAADQRTAVCRALVQQLRSAQATIEAAVNGLDGVFWADPQSAMDSLPILRGYAPPGPPPRAEQVASRKEEELRADLLSPSAYRRSFARNVLAGLQQARAGGTKAELLIYEPGTFNGQGRASVSIGDLATADHVAMLTPGILNSPSDMGPTAVTALGLKAEAESIAPGEESAVVLWFGYDIPGSFTKDPVDSPPDEFDQDFGDVTAALDAHAAQRGGELLAGDAAWIKSLASPDATLTLIGHSMGSTTTSEAARFPLPVDNIVLLASPGAGYDAQRAVDYASVEPEEVFVLSYDDDPVTQFRADVAADAAGHPWVLGLSPPVNAARYLLVGIPQPFGTDPAGAQFDAEVIDASSNRPVSNAIAPVEQHAISNYLSGAALLAVAQVLVGRTSRVRRKPGRSGP